MYTSTPASDQNDGDERPTALHTPSRAHCIRILNMQFLKSQNYLILRALFRSAFVHNVTICQLHSSKFNKSKHHSKEGRGLEANFPKQMQHSPSEWPLKTFAEGTPKSCCPHAVVFTMRRPKSVKNDMERSRAADSSTSFKGNRPIGVKEWYTHWR